jgi:hypothetical protein
MDINDKLNIIDFKNEQKLSMDYNQTKDKQTNDLYNQMISAKENVKVAPIKAVQATEKYYHFIGEKDPSIEMEATQFGNEIANNHQSLVDSIHQKIQYYDSQYQYLNQLDVMLFDYYKQILKQLNRVKNDLTQSTTNDRKVYYINEELSVIDAWFRLLLFIQLFILIQLIIEYVFDYKNILKLGGIILLILFMTPLFYNFCVWLFGVIGYLVYLKPFTYTHL